MSYKPTVAVVGLNGSIGSHLLEAYRSPLYGNKIQLPIIAVTRDASTKKSDSVVTYVTASPSDEAALTKAFKGADIVFNLIGVHGNPDIIAKAAHEAGAKVFFPSEFVLDYSKSKYEPAFAFKANAVKYARSLGLKTVEVQTNLFLDWVIASPVSVLLVDIAGGSFTRIGDGNQVITGNFLADVGKSLAKLSTIPVSELPNVVRLSGDTLTVNGLVETYEKASGKKLQVIPKTLDYVTEPAEKIVAAGLKGIPDFFDVLKAAIASGEANFSHHNDNELVNPGEKDFKWKPFYPELAKAFSK